ncbi:MAG: alpha-hydroxy-acid oxidizing protein [Rhodoferax sp.]|nr:alpha-hydroxy-acid oxidizing protein [Rhodoferax sp.]
MQPSHAPPSVPAAGNGADAAGLVHTVLDARRLAARRLPRTIFDFIDGAAGQERAAGLNQTDLVRIRLAPRVLADVSGVALASSFLGHELRLPFGIAPMGMCNLAWPGADRALAAQAVHRGIPLCLSTASSTSIEDMHTLTGGRTWFQLYVSGGADAGFAMADRAAKAGYEFLILTVDVPKVAPRPRDLRNGFQTPFRIRPRQLLDFGLHPQWSVRTLLAGIPTTANFRLADGSNQFDRNASRAGADWAFLEQLRARWTGQLIVKGVLNPDDAQRIKDLGADAIYVSNHGGRQLDSAPSAISALLRIRQRVGPAYPLVFDSGVRSGEDIVKALACGANLVMLGRPMLYALGADGARGLHDLVGALAEEIRVALAQLGLRDIRDVGRGHLAQPDAPLA